MCKNKQILLICKEITDFIEKIYVSWVESEFAGFLCFFSQGDFVDIQQCIDD